MGEQFENKQYDPTQFGAKQFPGGGNKTAATCDGVYYANRSDVELIFGESNVLQWADVDNDGNTGKIDARVCWALQCAKAYFDDMLNGGPYAVPFVLPYPQQIIVENARYAGCALYDSRGVVDTDGDGKAVDALTQQRNKTQTFITRVLANQTQLYGLDGTKNTPGVYDDSSDTLPSTIAGGN
jgi:phage gp36-like protein